MNTTRIVTTMITLALMIFVINGTVNATVPVYGTMSGAGYGVLDGGSGASDITPPVTTLSPPAATITVPQSVTISCSDGAGSGCAAIYYCLGGGCTPTTLYTAPLYISTTTMLTYYATDNAGNPETLKTAGFTIVQPPSFTASGAMTYEGRIEHTATLLPSGKVLVTGGRNHSYDLDTTELYDPVDNTWSAAASMSEIRYGHTATLLPNGKVLVIGGFNATIVLSSAELYDPADNSWSAAAGMSTARIIHTATLLPNGKVLVTGGFSNTTVLSSAELYDPVSNSWSAASGMSIERFAHSSTLLADGKVLVTGGSYVDQDSNLQDLSSAEVYDPANNSWSAAGVMSEYRDYHTATLLPSGKVLVAGTRWFSRSGHADLYDPAGNTWSVTAPMNYSRWEQAATMLADGKVFLSGGYGSAGYDLAAEVYDPAINTWVAVATMLVPRFKHTATLLDNGDVLLAGGWNYDGVTHDADSAELYDPTIEHVPGEPQRVHATAGHTKADVSFTPPAVSGGSVITSYTVTASPGGITASGSGSPITVSGLTNGTSYMFTVTAVNAVGMGPPSLPSNSVTPFADLVSPTTTPSPVGGGHNGSRSVTLSCDDGAGTGCASTRYCLGSGCTPLLPYDLPIALTSSQLLRFFSQDNAGNSETVKSAFYTINPVRLVGPGWIDPPWFESITDATGSAQNGDTIQTEALTFVEDLHLDAGRIIAIEGGYNNSFTNNSGDTVLQGTLTIDSDAVTIKKLTIR